MENATNDQGRAQLTEFPQVLARFREALPPPLAGCRRDPGPAARPTIAWLLLDDPMGSSVGVSGRVLRAAP